MGRKTYLHFIFQLEVGWVIWILLLFFDKASEMCPVSVLLTYCLWAPCCSSLFCSLLLRLYSPASPWSSTKDEVGTGCSRELLSLAEDDWLPSVTSTRMVLLGPSWLQMPFWQVSWWSCDFSTAKGCPQPQRNGCKQHVAEPAYLKS